MSAPKSTQPLTALQISALQDMRERPLIDDWKSSCFFALRPDGSFGQRHQKCTIQALIKRGLATVENRQVTITTAGALRVDGARQVHEFRAAQKAAKPTSQTPNF